MAQQNNDIVQNALQDYITKNIAMPGTPQKQAFDQLMQDPNVSQLVNHRIDTTNQYNSDLYNTFKQTAASGDNPLPAMGMLAGQVPHSESALDNFVLGLLQTASGNVNNDNNNATQTYGNVLNNNVQQGNLNLNRANSGWTDVNGNTPTDANGQSSGNVRVDTWSDAVRNGMKSIDAVPSDIAPLVYKQLTKTGYDVAKPINSDIAGIVGLYGNGNNSLSQANNFGQAAHNELGALLNYISLGNIQTPTEQRVKQYQDAINNFKKKYQGVLGGNIDLPSVNDTAGTAQEKFTKLMKQVRNIYYNGGAGPTTQRTPLSAFNK